MPSGDAKIVGGILIIFLDIRLFWTSSTTASYSTTTRWRLAATAKSTGGLPALYQVGARHPVSCTEPQSEDMTTVLWTVTLG